MKTIHHSTTRVNACRSLLIGSVCLVLAAVAHPDRAFGQANGPAPSPSGLSVQQLVFAIMEARSRTVDADVRTYAEEIRDRQQKMAEANLRLAELRRENASSTEIEQQKSQIEDLNSSSQLDMIKVQGLINQRNQSVTQAQATLRNRRSYPTQEANLRSANGLANLSTIYAQNAARIIAMRNSVAQRGRNPANDDLLQRRNNALHERSANQLTLAAAVTAANAQAFQAILKKMQAGLESEAERIETIAAASEGGVSIVRCILNSNYSDSCESAEGGDADNNLNSPRQTTPVPVNEPA